MRGIELTPEQIAIAVEMINAAFEGQPVVECVVGPETRINVRPNGYFKHAYTAGNGKFIGVSDSYGVVSGSRHLDVDPGNRTIILRQNNAYGKEFAFSWTLKNATSENYDQVMAIHDRLWEITRIDT